ncbi:MAG TPA: thiamine phosphate synthase [Gammaproteobacteria bacterium]|nr:thiamine phosphate synthase [Gammaproteobacteria bacterium]
MNALTRRPLRGLYAITPARPPAGMSLVECVAGYLAGGAQVIQYRDKSADHDTRERTARELLAACRARRIPLIINDDVVLAARVGADGVHLGRHDPPYDEARRRLGPDALIGVSCYNELDRAEEAAARGADYVAFGSFFPSTTKPSAVPVAPDLLRRARARVDLPLVAIGGITPDNGTTLLEAGADMLAVIGGLITGGSPRQAARAYARLFGPRRGR